MLVSPEHDHFPPAALVNAAQAVMLDWAYKPAGVVSYSGISGGLRAAQDLRQLLGNVNVHALPQTVPMLMASQLIGEDGVLRPNEPKAQGAATMLDERHEWVVALETIPAPRAAAAAQVA